MKRFYYIAIVGSLLLSVSCKRNTEDETPEGYIKYQEELLKETEPIRYDSNGDGVIDDTDKTIGILGTNLNISHNADGTPFYKGSPSSDGSSGDNPENPDDSDNPNDPTQGGDDSQSNSGVAVGKKLCYMNLSKYCDKNGGLYAFETTVNTSKSSVANTYSDADADKNGIADYIENIRSEAQINSIAEKYAKAYATQTEKNIENKASGKQISSAFVQECIKEAIVAALQESLYHSNETIDISNVETTLNTQLSTAIVDAVNEAGIINYINNTDLADIASSTAKAITNEVTEAIASTVTSAILAQYEKQVTEGSIEHVQGICPNGYHIPSDVEWMIFEQALGMSAADLTKSGETEIERGADVNIVDKLVNDFGFNYGGYASVNGTYAQLGEAGVFWSSTIGTDEKGDYVWVRQIDTSYNGIIRFKMYEKSGLSVRCFKD